MKPVDCLLRAGNEPLAQVRIWAAGVVLRSLYCIVVTKRELSRKAKLSIYWSFFVPTLTYGYEGWVMTERTRLRVQAAEMSFLRRVAGVSLRDRVRSSVIRERLGLEPLLLCLERSQLRWFGHLVRMPTGRLPWEVFQARPVGRRPRGRPRTRWRDYISTLAWERLRIPPRESWSMWPGKGKSRAPCLSCCPSDPTPDKRMTMAMIMAIKVKCYSNEQYWCSWSLVVVL